ncbi:MULTISPECIES: DUF397 domain-containing protein [unclassified Streptomyces]|uniref:DUF397 domain-containing protein n=1 Tax=unclassified Streptomyces TaxID=2593676 RepID=UPI0022579D67|nr:DUF397 domain-containing protein [Streptomyces sp. NBC_01500]MCX4548182.1 DUF397 domain-containing protein [Streptomyces sp. NBC_01500]WSV53863.1 DUF397 domain-containing protein [Streptomyces sp. NBC_01014]
MNRDRLPLPDLAGTAWHVSSYSGGQGECVEVGHNLPHLVPVRDSKRPTGPVLTFSHDAWRSFIHSQSS